jgi:hypothetical protein
VCVCVCVCVCVFVCVCVYTKKFILTVLKKMQVYNVCRVGVDVYLAECLRMNAWYIQDINQHNQHSPTAYHLPTCIYLLPFYCEHETIVKYAKLEIQVTNSTPNFFNHIDRTEYKSFEKFELFFSSSGSLNITSLIYFCKSIQRCSI